MRNLTAIAVVWFAQCVLLVQASGYGVLPRAASPSAAPTPVSVSPSQNWDGDDGPWSSFTIQVGTPVQDVRVFVSSNNAATWVVLPAGCNVGDSDCSQNRGLAFNPNASSTWSLHGNYELSTEQNLNLSAGAIFGNDTLGLGIQGSGGPVLQNQVIGAFTDADFYLGYFGVNSAVINFTNAESQPSYLTTLKDQNLIPSVSFGYTAGNQYRLKQVLGSLTLGGYDAGRFTPNGLSFPFADDSSRSLMVGVQSISSTDQTGTNSVLLASGDGFMTYVDSTVAQIWLPLKACQAFEEAFGITFDETSQLYLVNDSLHNQLQAQNSSVTFELGAGTSDGQTINITLPYDSFDLLVEPPTPGVANNTRYFPLRRAANESQYTIGRTFLQEAYLTVDWERRNFSISQCLFDDNMQQNLVPIMPNATSSSLSSGSSKGKTVGIAVAVVVIVVGVAGALGWIFWKKHQKSKKAAKGVETPPDELVRQGFAKGELDTGNDNQRYEMPGSEPVKPPQASHTPNGWVNEKANYPGDRSGMAEVEGGDVSSTPELPLSQRHQMHGFHEMFDPSAPSMAPVELPGVIPQPREMEGSNPTSPTSSPRPSARSPLISPRSPSSQSSRPRSWKTRFSRPQPSRKSTQESTPSQVSAPTPPPKPSSGPSSTPPTEVFSPVSRRGTGTFRSDNEGPALPRAGPILSPISPYDDNPRPNRSMFERLRAGVTNEQNQ